jgi:hypothetical protein
MAGQEELFKAIAGKLSKDNGGELSQMFGKPCIKVNGKAACAFFQDEFVVKVGAEEANSLLKKYEGSQLFDPSGKKRPMKDWLQVPYDYKKDWEKLAKQAFAYVEATEKAAPKKPAAKKAAVKKTTAAKKTAAKKSK